MNLRNPRRSGHDGPVHALAAGGGPSVHLGVPESPLRSASALALIFFAAGCSSGGFRIEPSQYEVTPEMQSYADGLEPRDKAMDVHPIPYVFHGAATHRFASDFDWWLLLYMGHEQFGKLADGYAYQKVSMVWPVWVGVRTHLFGADGKKRGSHRVDALGIIWPLPTIFLLGVGVEAVDDRAGKEEHTDVGFYLFCLPATNRALFQLSTAGIDLFFFRLWEKDRRPRE
jgi:hypothetical protein